MSAIYKKGEIVWAKIQGYSWWPGRITKIKLKLCINKDRLGKVILKYEKEPYFYITFFPNDSISKVKLKYIKKFIDGYQLRPKNNKRKKLNKAIDIATKAFLEENPNLNMDIKRNIFNIKLFSKKKFPLLRQFRALEEEEEEQNGENDIQSFIDSEMNECENYKNELKEKNNNKKYIGNKRKKSYDDKEKENENSEIFFSESDDSMDKEYNINKKCNRELKKYSNELYISSVEIKRKNAINNIIQLFTNIENIINKYDIDYNFSILQDLIFILNNYNNYNNEIIMNKSISLHKNLISKYLDNFFKYDYDLLKKESTESELFVNIEENNNYNDILLNLEELENNIISEIDKLNKKNNKQNTTLINIIISTNKNNNKDNNNNIQNKDSIKKENKKIKIDNYLNNNKKTNYKQKNNYQFGINQELTDEITINNNINNESANNKNNNKNIIKIENDDKDILNNDSINNNEPFLKDILNNTNYFNKKPEGQLYPDNFFKDIYLKDGINSKSELLRKKMCLQLYNVLKLVLPSCQEDIFKKNVIFLEYLARHIDPLFGNKYMTIINLIYNTIKNEAVKIKNKNKNKK